MNSNPHFQWTEPVTPPDPDRVAGLDFTGYISLHYIQQRMRRSFASTNGAEIPPERLERFFPPAIIEELRQIDWTRSDLPLAFALVSRLTWIWDLWFEQVRNRVHSDRDRMLYYSLRWAAFYQLQQRTSLVEEWELFCANVPHGLPEYPHADDASPDAEFRIRTGLDIVLKSIEAKAAEEGIDPRAPQFAAAFYSYDRDFYKHREEAHAAIIRYGDPGRNHVKDVHYSDYSQRRTITRRFRHRRKKEPFRPEVALFAVQRMITIWQAVEAAGQFKSPDERWQKVYHVEYDLASSTLARSPDSVAEYRMFWWSIPLFLRTLPPARSVSMRPTLPSTHLQDVIRHLELLCAQLEINHREVLSRADVTAWYPAGHAQRFRDVLSEINALPARTALLASITERVDERSISPDAPEGTSVIQDRSIVDPDPPPSPRRGRPRIALPYETAVRIWWQLADDLETRKPTQEEFCDRLTMEGYPMSVRTLSDRCKKWENDGHFWPPRRD